MSSNTPGYLSLSFHSTTSHIIVSLVINAHPMLTRGKTDRFKPLVCMVHSELTMFKQAMIGPE